MLADLFGSIARAGIQVAAQQASVRLQAVKAEVEQEARVAESIPLVQRSDGVYVVDAKWRGA